MPLSSPSHLNIHLPTEQLLHSLTHSSRYSVTNRRCRPQNSALYASFSAGCDAAPLRTPKYHEWTHQAGAEAETRLAEEDEE